MPGIRVKVFAVTERAIHNPGRPTVANFKNTIPASLRRQVESSQFAYSLMARSQKVEPKLPVRQSGFMRLPGEPEDAKITGVTRSLTRRLLALNMPKVKVAAGLAPLAGVKTA